MRPAKADPAGARELPHAVRTDELLERIELLGRPTTSKMSASGPISTTRAPNTSPSAISSARLLRRRRDRDQRSSRSTDSPGSQLDDAQDVDELVHLLLDLLERVLAAVDAHRDPRDVAPLGRPDGEALDVVAAPREHLEMRVSAPGLFSTTTERVWSSRCLDRLAFVGISMQVDRGGAGRDHREAVLLRIDPGVDDGGAAASNAARGRLELVLAADREPGAP